MHTYLSGTDAPDVANKGHQMHNYFFVVGGRTYQIVASSREAAAAKLAALQLSGRIR